MALARGKGREMQKTKGELCSHDPTRNNRDSAIPSLPCYNVL